MTLCLNVTLVIWTYLKSWLDEHCLRGTARCIVKRTVPSTYYIVQRNLIVCLEKLSVIVNCA